MVLLHARGPLLGLLPLPGPAGEVLASWVRSGLLGVDVFFVLSGFVIGYVYGDRLARPTWRRYGRFLWARFARVYPVHLFTLLVLLLGVVAAGAAGIGLGGWPFTARSFWGNVALLQVLPGIGAWNGPSWTISLEAAAYLAFPAVALLAARFRRPAAALIVAGLWLSAGAALLAVRLAAGADSDSGVVAWLRIATGFPAGVLALRAWDLLGRPRGRRGDRLAALAALVVAGWLAVADGRGWWMILAVPALGAGVVALATAAGRVSRLLGSRPLQAAGRVSYSLYLTHFLTLGVLTRVCPWGSYVGAPLGLRLAVVAGYLTATGAVALLSYVLVEQPARRALRRLVPAS